MLLKNNKRVVCKDGFSVSIQADEGKYCEPRVDNATYTSVELGYPSEGDWIIAKYAEQPNHPTETVYGYVPVETVYLLLTKHGGVESGEVPKGVPVYENTHPRRER